MSTASQRIHNIKEFAKSRQIETISTSNVQVFEDPRYQKKHKTPPAYRHLLEHIGIPWSEASEVSFLKYRDTHVQHQLDHRMRLQNLDELHFMIKHIRLQYHPNSFFTGEIARAERQLEHDGANAGISTAKLNLRRMNFFNMCAGREQQAPTPPKRNGLKFLMIAEARSGSSWLQSLLDSHPNITFKGEGLLNLCYRWDGCGNPDAKGEPKIIPWHATKADLDKIFVQQKIRFPETKAGKWWGMRPSNEYAWGFKVFPQQGVANNLDNVIEYCQKNDIYVIHLSRNNVVSQYISVKAHDLNAKWNSAGFHDGKATGKNDNSKTLGVQWRDMQGYILTRLQNQYVIQKALRKLDPKKVLILQYEDFIRSTASYECGIARILSFLHIEASSQDLNTKFSKMHTKPLHKYISNWQELLSESATWMRQYIEDTDKELSVQEPNS